MLSTTLQKILQSFQCIPPKTIDAYLYVKTINEVSYAILLHKYAISVVCLGEQIIETCIHCSNVEPLKAILKKYGKEDIPDEEVYRYSSERHSDINVLEVAENHFKSRIFEFEANFDQLARSYKSIKEKGGKVRFAIGPKSIVMSNQAGDCSVVPALV